MREGDAGLDVSDARACARAVRAPVPFRGGAVIARRALRSGVMYHQGTKTPRISGRVGCHDVGEGDEPQSRKDAEGYGRVSSVCGTGIVKVEGVPA